VIAWQVILIPMGAVSQAACDRRERGIGVQHGQCLVVEETTGTEEGNTWRAIVLHPQLVRVAVAIAKAQPLRKCVVVDPESKFGR
jgi:hypothetical protein